MDDDLVVLVERPKGLLGRGEVERSRDVCCPVLPVAQGVDEQPSVDEQRRGAAGATGPGAVGVGLDPPPDGPSAPLLLPYASDPDNRGRESPGAPTVIPAAMIPVTVVVWA